MDGGLSSKLFALEPILRRSFWRPARRALEIFHPLPWIAALTLFVLFSSNGQMREIYLSAFESWSAPSLDSMTAVALACGIVGLTLLSALLFVAHFELSRLRAGFIYASYADPDAGSRLRLAQRAAGVLLALSPWLGVILGYLGATRYVSQRYEALNAAGAGSPELQSLHAPRPWQIVIACALIGFALALTQDVYRRGRFARILGAAASPVCAALLLLFFTDSSPGFDRGAWMEGALLAAAALIAGRVYLAGRLKQIVYRATGPAGAGFMAYHRRRILFLVALLPWATLPAALFLISPSWLSDDAALSLGVIPLAIGSTMAVGLLVGLALDRMRDQELLKWSLVGAIVLLTFLDAAASSLGLPTLVAVFRWIGPLGSISFECALVIASFALLAWLSQRTGFPALALVLAIVVVSALLPSPGPLVVIGLAATALALCIVAILSRLYVVAALALVLAAPSVLNLIDQSSASEAQPILKAGPSVKTAFHDWINRQRPIWAAQGASACAARLNGVPLAASARAKQPVYIVAAEGGGIYAASAASLMLAALQDECPDFTSHVFVISGVSGGAVGSALFAALDEARLERIARGAPAGPSLTSEVSQVLLDDHLSPVVAAILPDLFGAPIRRAQAQATSFESSVRSVDAAAAADLCKSFLEQWNPRTLAPALALNTTWVETGFRVAFAPFALHSPIDQSLYSFLDANMPESRKVGGSVCGSSSSISVIDAAIDSARFPGMLPPYSVRMKEKNGRRLLWNFVDGGYSDNSGASTALAIYKELLPLVNGADKGIDLQLLLMVSSYASPDLSPDRVEIDGTPFRNTLAPIDAVLAVRNGISREAIARVCDYFHDEKCAGDSPSLHIVDLDDRTFALPLGWKLSKTTFDLIRWMIGQPEICAKERRRLPRAAPTLSAASPVATERPLGLFDRLARAFDLASGGAPLGGPGRLRSLRLSNSCVMAGVAADL